MGPMRVRSRRRGQISSCPATKGISAAMAAFMRTDAPSGTTRATASRMDISVGAGTRPSYTGRPTLRCAGALSILRTAPAL